MVRKQHTTTIEIDLIDLDEDDVLNFVRSNFAPKDVFGKSTMDDWFEAEAKDRDYVPDPGE